MLHVVARRPQDVQSGGWNPPLGFRHAAPAFDVTVRSRQPHWPVVLYVWFACTETQYVPGPSDTTGLSGIEKLGPFVNAMFGLDSRRAPGRSPAPFE